ncbi:MAG: SprT family zinc-dependent metalloprotease [Polyangiales bacterium]
MESLTVGDLSFEVRRSARRRSVEITVDRGGELVIAAPESCAMSTLEGFVVEKRAWIYTKLAEKAALQHDAPRREYVTGEGFAYLGRSHRLLLVDGQREPVKLEEGRFKMRRDVAPKGHEAMVRWYTEHARPWLTERVARWCDRIGATPAGVHVRDLGYRWGSCSARGVLYFHWRTILLPPRVVEYVVVHELVHLIEAHHAPAFWQRIERALPDYAARKLWLDERGAAVANV